MRLRLMDGGTEFAVLEVQSATALAEAIAGLHGARHARPDAARPLYNEAWWNLSDDLSQFFAWVIETGAATLGETRAFAADPLCRPDWLFEAARQMKMRHGHLWYNEAWWNLSDDLSQFFAWVIETGAATLGETRAFAADPLCRPDWLFEAARQMKKLLDVAAGVTPCTPC